MHWRRVLSNLTQSTVKLCSLLWWSWMTYTIMSVTATDTNYCLMQCKWTYTRQQQRDIAWYTTKPGQAAAQVDVHTTSAGQQKEMYNNLDDWLCKRTYIPEMQWNTYNVGKYGTKHNAKECNNKTNTARDCNNIIREEASRKMVERFAKIHNKKEGKR